jgi:hypothetical protein
MLHTTLQLGWNCIDSDCLYCRLTRKRLNRDTIFTACGIRWLCPVPPGSLNTRIIPQVKTGFFFNTLSNSLFSGHLAIRGSVVPVTDCEVNKTTDELNNVKITHVMPIHLFSGLSRSHTVIQRISLFDETCAVLGYYAALCGNCLPTFRDTVSVPSFSFWTRPLKLGPIGCPETSVNNYQKKLRSIPEDLRSR